MSDILLWSWRDPSTIATVICLAEVAFGCLLFVVLCPLIVASTFMVIAAPGALAQAVIQEGLLPLTWRGLRAAARYARRRTPQRKNSQ